MPIDGVALASSRTKITLHLDVAPGPMLFYTKEILPRPRQGIILEKKAMHTMTARRVFRTIRELRAYQKLVAAFLVFLIASTPAITTDQASASSQHGLDQIRSYIASGWDSLTRSMADCKSIADPKLAATSVLYIPADFDIPAAVQRLQKECKVQVQHLPGVIHKLGEVDPGKIEPAGLLYLPNEYVVPGGRFNEMYGWDSYFIIRGLVRDNRVDLAQGMVENFFFEIEHYGAVLNANRTYYLTRSQPPFLTSMILAVYDAQKAAGHESRQWLEKAYSYAVRDHELWTREPHLAGSTGLSRYYDFGSGPAPESLKDETGHYRQVAAFFLAQPGSGRGVVIHAKSGDSSQSLVGPLFAQQVCDTTTTMARSDCTPAGTVSLSAEYYEGDRAMRESGYDISFRFGPFGASTHHYAPVCLNSLLYKTEQDLSEISSTLDRKQDAEDWRKRADDRKDRIQKYLWDGKRGLYFDYDFENQIQSSYEYVTTFVPMWAGVATPEQASAIMRNLAVFEKPGGLVMSPHETGGQWDYPYAWAPNQLLADEGIRRYGFKDDADRVSYEFLSTVAENFRHDGTIREKYNAVTRSSETQVTAGYHMNIVGFGWTNGVFLELLHELPQNAVVRLAEEQKPAPGSGR
jgi:alpha,alpha-trehalase